MKPIYNIGKFTYIEVHNKINFNLKRTIHTNFECQQTLLEFSIFHLYNSLIFSRQSQPHPTCYIIALTFPSATFKNQFMLLIRINSHNYNLLLFIIIITIHQANVRLRGRQNAFKRIAEVYWYILYIITWL